MAKVTKDFLKENRKTIEAELKALGEKLGVTFKAGSGSYEPDGSAGHYKLEITEVRDDGVTAEQLKFNKVCQLYNLKPQDFGKTLKVNGRDFKLVGLNTRAPKNPVMIKCLESGGSFKASERVLKQIQEQ